MASTPRLHVSQDHPGLGLPSFLRSAAARLLGSVLAFTALLLLSGSATLSQDAPAAGAGQGQTRPARTEAELREWLENMVWHHQYSMDEVELVTGLDQATLRNRLDRFGIAASTRPARPADRLLVLPYPGGRHPRIGFLDGAVNPQRETKLSVFCPWDDEGYAVLDFPEAIWSNLGLTYLAHTHIDTIWTKQGVELPQQEWSRSPDGSFSMVRSLPNGIQFGVHVKPLSDHLRMRMWLHNGTRAPLTDLRVQNCIMLKGAPGFEGQTNENKRLDTGYAVVRSPDAARWMICSWDPLHRNWGNDRCPCLHSDPKFPDCGPGETQWLRGWFSFFEGPNIDAELARIESTGWRTRPLQEITGNVLGKVLDAKTNEPLACRLYAQSLEDGRWHFATSASLAGSAVVYDKQLRQTASVERHTTLSADGFQLDLPPGRYRIRAQRGKEYLPSEAVITVGDGRQQVTLKLRRFENMAARGWYSGDTHVHRSLSELPNAMLAEDLNVALPLTYWVRDSGQVPSSSGPALDAEAEYVDATHVIYPVNTEYEIFTVDRKRHTQGAVFVLGHQTPLQLSAPPTKRIAEEARRQRALLDLDKHSWNWSLMVVPLMDVDLFELSNNHHWRTEFGFPRWTVDNAPPDWPEIERDASGFTERGWTDFGFQTYYALLNCGFRLRVSAGTASGVHPVPLGHGRVYVHTGDQFSYEAWIQGLDAGHSFVTQGPLMHLTFDGELPGTTWRSAPEGQSLAIAGEIASAQPLLAVEVIRNGEVALHIDPESTKTPLGSYVTTLDAQVEMDTSGWVAVRCYQQPEQGAPQGKVVFAHTNPVFVDIVSKPLRPRRRDVEYFIQRMEAEIARNTDVLSDEAVAEFRQAKAMYETILEQAR